ncbi:MFS transporter [Falsiroseomonas sp. CW058]|uniref:MFS transporter n=1 Tax=Falsiroseomonas sp. CW058 TaxID=3388664 RepID=UPI003D31109B
MTGRASAPGRPTDWPAVWAMLLAGIAGAAQIGKVPAAMTTIGAEFGLGLSGAALLVSLFALLAGLGGLAIGLGAARIGPRRALLGGIGIGAAAAFAAALAPSTPPLLLARIAEGAGFLLLTVAAPALISAATAGRDRSLAMGLWGTYMPLGVALGLVTAPVVEAFGWRSAWLALAALLGATLLLCWRLVPDAEPDTTTRPSMRAQLSALRAARRPMRVAAAFAAYNVMYLGIAAFLPARLEHLGAGTGAAGAAAALAALANAAGNLVSGLLMQRGAAPERLVLAGAACMSVLAAGVYIVPHPAAAVLLAIAACGVGGLLPAACFALVPRAVPVPALVAPAVGLVIQGNNLAQLLVPPALGALATVAWWMVAPPLLVCGLLAALSARGMSR